MPIIINPAEQAMDGVPQPSTTLEAAWYLIIHAAETFSQYAECPDMLDQRKILTGESTDLNGACLDILDELRTLAESKGLTLPD